MLRTDTFRSDRSSEYELSSVHGNYSAPELINWWGEFTTEQGIVPQRGGCCRTGICKPVTTSQKPNPSQTKLPTKKQAAVLTGTDDGPNCNFATFLVACELKLSLCLSLSSTVNQYLRQVYALPFLCGTARIPAPFSGSCMLCASFGNLHQHLVFTVSQVTGLTP
jgi:hypothetical protein